MQRIEDLVRIYKAALDSRLRTRVTVTHPIMKWMVEHAAALYNRYVTNDDGTRTMKLVNNVSMLPEKLSSK